MEKLSETTVTKRLETEVEEEEALQVPIAHESAANHQEEQGQSEETQPAESQEEKLEIQHTGMVWAVVMCLGAFQEIYLKSVETLEIVRDNPSNFIEQAVYASRAFGMLFIIYLLLRVLIDRKFLAGKSNLLKLLPCFLHSLALSPYFLFKLSDLSLNRAEQGKILMQWGIELLSSAVIVVAYRVEDSSESPLLQMKPYVFKKPTIDVKED